MNPYHIKNAVYCLKHSKNNPVHYKCIICNATYPIKTQSLKPVLARLCFYCGLEKRCCYLNTEQNFVK